MHVRSSMYQLSGTGMYHLSGRHMLDPAVSVDWQTQVRSSVYQLSMRHRLDPACISSMADALLSHKPKAASENHAH